MSDMPGHAFIPAGHKIVAQLFDEQGFGSVEQGFGVLGFGALPDFRLSGNVDTMNFQWAPAEVKKKIQTRIPNFSERKIERNIDFKLVFFMIVFSTQVVGTHAHFRQITTFVLVVPL